ncbi:MAG: asparaginase [Calditrichia bacterium]
MKKILLIHTGGTFGMLPLKPSATLAPADIQKHILTYLPEIQQIADIDFEVAFNIDSANIQIEHWQKLAKLIYSNYHRYDGFVIIHGTDAMVYTAAALSFALRGLSKPIILTGSQRPLAQIRSDARSNLINSLELATYSIPEVSIFFGTRLYRGNRAIKVSTVHYEAFTSPNYPVLAEVGLDITLSDYIREPGKKLQYREHFDSRVFCFQYFPGLSPHYLDCLLNSPLQIVVITALGAGNLAVQKNSLIPWIEQMNRENKIVAINSQSPFGRVDLTLYQSGLLLKKAGALSSGDMTIPATIVKLMFLLGKYPHSMEKIKQHFEKPLAGELTVE